MVSGSPKRHANKSPKKTPKKSTTPRSNSRSTPKADVLSPQAKVNAKAVERKKAIRIERQELDAQAAELVDEYGNGSTKQAIVSILDYLTKHLLAIGVKARTDAARLVTLIVKAMKILPDHSDLSIDDSHKLGEQQLLNNVDSLRQVVEEAFLHTDEKRMVLARAFKYSEATVRGRATESLSFMNSIIGICKAVVENENSNLLDEDTMPIQLSDQAVAAKKALIAENWNNRSGHYYRPASEFESYDRSRVYKHGKPSFQDRPKQLNPKRKRAQVEEYTDDEDDSSEEEVEVRKVKTKQRKVPRRKQEDESKVKKRKVTKVKKAPAKEETESEESNDDYQVVEEDEEEVEVRKVKTKQRKAPRRKQEDESKVKKRKVIKVKKAPAKEIELEEIDDLYQDDEVEELEEQVEEELEEQVEEEVDEQVEEEEEEESFDEEMVRPRIDPLFGRRASLSPQARSGSASKKVLQFGTPKKQFGTPKRK